MTIKEFHEKLKNLAFPEKYCICEARINQEGIISYRCYVDKLSYTEWWGTPDQALNEFSVKKALVPDSQEDLVIFDENSSKQL